MTDRPFVSFDEVKQKVSIRDVLQEFGILDRFRECNGSLVGVCPFPDHIHGPSPNSEQFRVSQVDGIELWRCWGDCKQSGNVVQFVMRMEGLSAAHVRFWFATHFGDRLNLKRQKGREPKGGSRDKRDTAKKKACPVRQTPEQAEAKTSSTATVSPETTDYKPIRFRLQLDPDVEYLRQRGISPEVIARYEIGLCQRGLLKGYVGIPVWDYPRGEYPIGYLGRWAGEDYDPDADRPRYKWPKNFPSWKFVYGLEQAVERSYAKTLIVVEGPFSVFYLAQNGYENCVAAFGSHLSETQAEILSCTGRQIVLMFDGDEAGHKGMLDAAQKTSARAFTRTIELPAGRNPDDLTVAELQKLLGDPIVRAS